MRCHGSSLSRRDVSRWVDYRQGTSRGSPPSTRFNRTKRQTWSFASTRGLGHGIRERRPQPSLRGGLASSSGAPPAAAEPRSGLRKGGVWRGSYATSPATSNKSGRPHPRARARFSRRPFVSATAGSEPATQRGRTFRAAGFPRSTIPRRRFHTTFVQTPEDADSAEGLVHSQSDPKLPEEKLSPVLMLGAAREAK